MQLALQPGLLLLRGFPPGVEVGARLGVGGAGLEELVGDLSRVCAIAVIAFFFAPGFLSPPKRRTSRLYRACSRPRTRIAFQAACTSIGLM